MKVIHLGSIPISEDHPDASQLVSHPGRWVLNLARAQRKHTAIRPQILLQASGAAGDFSTDIEGIPVHYIAAPARGRALTGFRFDVRRIEKKLQTLKPDFVHGHGTEDAYGPAAAHTSFPSVLTLQGMMFLINRIVRQGLLSRDRYVYFTERAALKRTKDVIAKSAYIAEAVKEEHPHLTIHRIPNAMDMDLLDTARAEREHRMVFVGTIIPRKGLHVFRAASKAISEADSNLRVSIVGNMNPSSDYETSELTGLKEIWGDRLTLHGRLAPKELYALLARSRMLLAPSLEEMFGNQLIEALMQGVHGIVSSGTALAENVQAFGNGSVFENGNPEDLAQTILQALSENHDDQADQTRQALIEAMGPEAVAQKHLDLYQSIIAR